MEGNKQRKHGFLRKAAALISGIEMSLLTTDAIPDKSYSKSKTSTSNNGDTEEKNTRNNTSVVRSNIINDNNDNERNKKEDNSSFFGVNNNKNRKKEKKDRSKAKDGAVYNFTKCSDVHIGNTFNLMRNVKISNQSSRQPKATVELTPEIKEILTNMDVVTKEHIMEVQSHIGDNWKDLGRRLGLNDGQLDQIKEDYSPQRERVYQMLLDWVRTETSKATVGVLCRHLWEVDEKHAVKVLASYVSRSNNLD